MYPFFPPIKPYQCHELSVGKPHVLYVEETGHPNGLPVLVVHSGPGAGGDTWLRRFFDPQIYRIINYDQRGCGRSTPHASLSANTTQLLLEDMEAIRDYLGLKRVMLFGGGWGAMLSLLYAERYPQYILTLLLHQIFLGRKKDTDWFYQQGANLVYPDYWQEFCHFAPDTQQHQITRYYMDCLQGDNELARMAAAKNWALWKARCSSLQPHSTVIGYYMDPHLALSLATLESWYINNNFFIPENEILLNINKIRHLPVYLIHGRYDMVCPLAGAWELHQALPASHLTIIRDAGHSCHEAGMADALIGAGIVISGQGLNVS